MGSLSFRFYPNPVLLIKKTWPKSENHIILHIKTNWLRNSKVSFFRHKVSYFRFWPQGLRNNIVLCFTLLPQEVFILDFGHKIFLFKILATRLFYFVTRLSYVSTFHPYFAQWHFSSLYVVKYHFHPLKFGQQQFPPPLPFVYW